MREAPVAVFEVDAALLEALEAALGPPLDSYLMGWQVWLEPPPEGPEVELEYRLHPPAGFEQPTGLSHHDLWDEVVQQIAAGAERLVLGEEQRRLAEVWELLEVFPAHGDDLEPEQVRASAEAVLGRSALAAGRVDHERLGGRWRRERHAFDLPRALRAELGVDG